MSHDGHSIVIGLTGQTGAGKSTVSKIFVREGFQIIDADRISRDVVELGTPCLSELLDYFGEEIRNEDGTLNRKALAKIVFNDKGRLDALNSICHPFITEEILARISRMKAQGHELILLDAPTLFESKAADFCDLIISVVASPDLRRERIIERDALTPLEAKERMSAQLDEEFFITHSDYVIRNDEDLQQLYALSEEIADKIKAYYHTTHIS
ncbi:MAG: dephospho-CoA kinase [Oscillospiraceae bacterium]|nr:dephospho-CoA kinase [Ruminococcus sp.]MBQ7002839.1 dephospho-CoA kinase [Oscillospiraceae bacterium]MBQ7014431.1 dephospho-CoA kinase [Oscillospiraceae bacterium]